MKRIFEIVFVIAACVFIGDSFPAMMLASSCVLAAVILEVAV